MPKEGQPEVPGQVPGARDNSFGPTPVMPEGYEAVPWKGKRPKVNVPRPPSTPKSTT